jgi:hypothetical protein
MARKPGQKPSTGSSKPGQPRKEKNKTQARTPMQRVMVMGPTGKIRFEWRPWEK